MEDFRKKVVELAELAGKVEGPLSLHVAIQGALGELWKACGGPESVAAASPKVEVVEAPSASKRRGRPKGSKNKNGAQAVAAQA
jgi:hypothetical protein